MTWLPEWRVTVEDDVYTTVTSVSYSSGRKDIDRQPTAGYCRVEIVNTDGSPFTINITDSVLLELKNGSGNYVTVFGGEVSDFTIGVRSPEETGYITTGTILGIGNLAKLPKAVYNTALAEGLDGSQIAAILDQALNITWAQVFPTQTWDTYQPTVTWAEAETSVGTVDAGFYTMTSQTASATATSQSLVDQIATSALGQIYESANGFVNYADADHRSDYLADNGYTNLDATYATPSSIKSITALSKVRNSLIYKYGTSYGSEYAVSNEDSVAAYGRNQRSFNSNIKNLADITDIANRELRLRAYPRSSLEAITFRLDNPELPLFMLDRLISVFFGQPILVENLPNNLLGGIFDGFVEDITMKATPTYVDLTLYISATDFSLLTTQWESVTPDTLIWSDVNAILTWENATGALI
jgi:hypothetical protein